GNACADWVPPPPAAPASVTASATSSTQVAVTWPAVSGATYYEIYRRAPGGSFALVGTSIPASFTDTGATANTAYLYRVRAVGPGGSSVDSPADLATTVIFSDDPLTNHITIKAVHLGELRTSVNAVRALANLSVASFTDPNPAGVVILAIHINELRAALDP